MSSLKIYSNDGRETGYRIFVDGVFNSYVSITGSTNALPNKIGTLGIGSDILNKIKIDNIDVKIHLGDQLVYPMNEPTIKLEA